ncbi:MAG: GTPase ObgE [Chitinophagaceae bacterium]|nr:MAG: GTPase ObgE [Chitinophagaceae bacterium]
MEKSNFVDYVKIYARSGSGGSGSAHFRREKYVPKGGPDGGDGGNGGHVIIKGNKQIWTLIHLKYRKHIFADNGKPGEGGNRSGKSGESQILEVPIGTIAKDADTGEKIGEILEHGEEMVLLEGGKGGLGNSHFKTSVNQTPRYAQPGIPGEEKAIVLELKLLADVGLVGFPNAGKSTLLSVVSAAKPKIADYAFTTLVPQLGIVPYKENLSFVMADIPGIIEGAHEGKGLGLRFLRHIERNSMLLFLVPADADNIRKQYDILVHELKSHNPELMYKRRILAISKADLVDIELKQLLKKDIPEDIPYTYISAFNKEGLEDLKKMIWETLNEKLPA